MVESTEGANQNAPRGKLRKSPLRVEYNFQMDFKSTKHNSFSIGHLLGAVTTQWLDRDGAVMVDNCQQHGKYTVDQLCI